MSSLVSSCVRFHKKNMPFEIWHPHESKSSSPKISISYRWPFKIVSDLLHMINVSLILSISLNIFENVNSLASRITLLVLISQNGYAPSKTTREQLKFCFSNFSEKIFFPWWPFKVLMECVRFFFLEKSMSSFSNMTKEQIKSPHFSENIHFPWGPLKLSILFRFVKTTWRNEMWQKTNSSSQNLSQNIYFPWGPLRMPVFTQFLKTTTCRFQMWHKGNCFPRVCLHAGKFS